MPLSDPQPPIQTQPVPDPSISHPDEFAWYVVPETAKKWLRLTAAHWDDPTLADEYIDRALAAADGHLDVLVSAYRYFFYTQNDRLALKMARQLLERVKSIEALPENWSLLKPILTTRRDDPNIRLYLNAYAASGLIYARLGEIAAAQEIAIHVSEIENRHEFGGNVVREILERPDDDDEYEE
ncbi:MAG: hypothetical protein SWY16_05585 [Cyanobacteriota bacterium]|nr:hypothetical protein [Cyanobacteriota bacterium]